MANFAYVKNNIVENIIVVADSDCGGGDFPDSEQVGQSFLASLATLEKDGIYLQTSLSSSFRKRYAYKGCSYSEEHDAFIAPKPYPSWLLNAELEWEAPVTKPDNSEYTVWDEHSQNWVS